MMSMDRKIDVTAMQFLLVQNGHKTNDWTLIGSDANGLGIQVCVLRYFPGGGVIQICSWKSKLKS